MTTSAKIIADSISDSQIRITTMELKYPLIIHGEFMTHRVFSRNAASNRAIPTKKIIDQVETDAFYPSHWGINKSGMQASEELTGDDLKEAVVNWEHSINSAIGYAEKLNAAGLHKQIANRVLMPYQYIKVIVTATEWDNFFKLRLHPDAQPEIQELAGCMKTAMYNSNPRFLDVGEWHLPYILEDEWVAFNSGDLNIETLQKASVARCARISFLNHDKTNPDLQKDIDRADKLLEDGHMSPFEHQGMPMKSSVRLVVRDMEIGATHIDRDDSQWSGNFRGWIQYRQLI